MKRALEDEARFLRRKLSWLLNPAANPGWPATAAELAEVSDPMRRLNLASACERALTLAEKRLALPEFDEGYRAAQADLTPPA